MPCHREDRHPAHLVRLLERAAELEAVHPGHREVSQHRLRAELERLGERLMTVVRVGGPEAGTTEDVLVQKTSTPIVIDDEYERIEGNRRSCALQLARS